MRISILLILFSAFGLLSACVSSNSISRNNSSSNSNGKSSKYVETFLVEGGRDQYFIKPLTYYSESSKKTIEVDFTFRVKNNFTQTTVKDTSLMFINLTHFPLEKVIVLPEVILHDSAGVSNLKKIAVFYQEKQKKQFKIRFGGELPSIKPFRVLYETKKGIKLKINNKEDIFLPTSKTLKVLEILSNSDF